MSTDPLERLTRHAVDVLPEGLLAEKLRRGAPLRVKLGVDPTGPDIHLGFACVLDRLAEFQLEGHTDYQGNPVDNLKLSQMRVDAVKSYIVSKKISKSRVKTKAFGGTQPLARDNNPEAHRANRRVELRVLEN